MAASSITEKALANSLKKLMHHYPINKIRVKMITDDCSVTRHTFYNHFKDVYDLLGWIYENEIIDNLDIYCNVAHWKEGILAVLQYTLDNKVLCLNTFRSLGREHLEGFLYKVFYHVLSGVIDNITRNMWVDSELKTEAADFYTNALMGIFIGWLKKGLKEDPNIVANRIEKMIKGNIISLMERYNKA
ncbi:TetR-like C-terminal domain-containing protein [Clostridium oryzae]|uniref:HTH-type dhaKLM operon transcriptional activator DhaS n=1 Tax=Clostridium oryzae TaxID=1450648 RepID=A0A1V4IKZ1_9CLOT|nr:TetR-like C-terminal domain-containing protein [Clostridium oryzae]OPJ60405.1 HTH-type dhaKLM operon transcriptional activator DhaS [Clostridium oryzae]